MQKTGLDSIKELNISSQSFLVSSHYCDPEIRNQCSKLNVRIIPKNYIDMIPIHFNIDSLIQLQTLPAPEVEAVLIDDDELTCSTWKYFAERSGKRLRTFQDPFEFLKTHDSIRREIPLYIDSHLKNNIKGEEFAKTLVDHGFLNIYLTTAAPKSAFKNVPYLKDIIGKAAPW